ncbi:hypothetical protein [Actinotalea sp. Marseille-Q4924]|uniref:hypothetical protein n=1 Tax=Actinotalea sp. Marseille-Q4924 TaxID=2866571 RepID=UPI001CE438E4|nr:hypothetical protein [Actinotalea sp. Marseille-Q4924]
MAGTGRGDAQQRWHATCPARGRARSALAVVLLASVVTGCGTAGTGTSVEGRPAETTGAGADAGDVLSAPDGAGARSGAGSAGAAADAVEPGIGPSRVGELVEDFPVDLLPVPDDAVLLVTSAVPVGGSAAREVSLNLRTQMSVGAVVRLYRGALTDAGFVEVTPPTDASGPTADATFTRSGGDEVVTIGVLDVDGARTLTLGGRVRAGGDG